MKKIFFVTDSKSKTANTPLQKRTKIEMSIHSVPPIVKVSSGNMMHFQFVVNL